ncbi:MAG: hypothetical protein H7Y88_12650, partial [Phycisphaerales bacterium]|nr:hypothetical protein [Phycisphaerales bacterium]
PDTAAIKDAALLGILIDRAGRIASTPDERVTHLLAQGRFRERAAELAGAVEVYHRILQDPLLRLATWSGSQSSLRAELEATWRLERLIQQHGPTVYAASEMAAAAETSLLTETAAVEQLESVVRRYPVAAITPALYLRIALELGSKGRAHASVTSLESGLRAARARPDADARIVAELGGRLVRALQGRGQVVAAATLLADLARQYPGLTLSDGASPMSIEGTLVELTSLRAQRERWPTIGNITGENLEVILGWSLLKPQARSMSGGTAKCLVMENGEQVGVWTPSPTGEVAQVWSAPLDGTSVDLLRLDDDTALLYYSGPLGGVMERVSAATAASLWKTKPFPQLFQPEKAPPAPGDLNFKNEPLIETPQDGAGGLSDLVFSLDEQTITLVERSGRAAAIDAATGQTLWAGRTPIMRVYDTDLASGMLVIAGEIDSFGGGGAGAQGAAAPTQPAIVIIEARTGQLLHRIIPEDSRQVRWLRGGAGSRGSLIVGLDTGIISIDANSAQINWRLSNRNLAKSQEAWVFGDRLYVVGDGRELWLVNAATGAMQPRPIEVPPEHLAEYQPLYASLLAGQPGHDEERVMSLSTLLGVVLVDPAGQVVGAAALGPDTNVVPPQPAADCLVTVETGAANHEADGRMAFNIHVMDTTSAKLRQTIPILLGARPRRLALLDGRIAITAGNSTIILHAP